MSDKQLLAQVRREIRQLEVIARKRNLTGEDAQEFLSRVKAAAYPKHK